MEVKNKTMYHLHKYGNYDEIWQPGNRLIIDHNFNGYAATIIDNFSTNIDNSRPLEETIKKIYKIKMSTQEN